MTLLLLCQWRKIKAINIIGIPFAIYYCLLTFNLHLVILIVLMIVSIISFSKEPFFILNVHLLWWQFPNKLVVSLWTYKLSPLLLSIRRLVDSKALSLKSLQRGGGQVPPYIVVIYLIIELSTQNVFHIFTYQTHQLMIHIQH